MSEHLKLEEILTEVETRFKDVFVNADALPKPYIGSETIKALLIGTDPGNSVGGETKIIDYVFGLEHKNSPYFRSIQGNIDKLSNLILENLYVQNICKNYFNCDASKNKDWKEAAKLWLPYVINEFDSQYDKSIPVLVSAEIILDIILKEQQTKLTAETYYSSPAFIDKADNNFERTLIPFYRHRKYSLSFWDQYREATDSFFYKI